MSGIGGIRTHTNQIKSLVPVHSGADPRSSIRDRLSFVSCFVVHIEYLCLTVGAEGIEPPIRVSATGLQPASEPFGEAPVSVENVV